MPHTTIDVDALYAALDASRKAKELSWRELAKELEISPSTFSRMAQGHRPDVDTFATLAQWMGVSAEQFMRAPAGKDALKKAEPVAMVSAFLRSSKTLKPDVAEALEDIFQAAYKRLTKKK